MSEEVVLKVEGLYKRFTMSLKRSMFYGTVDLMKGIVNKPIEPELRKGEFWALENINFELRRGETLALIGQNGCGKSTLLRLINGIFPPDKGKITINGRIGALIAVGAGFHPHMSGRENVYLNATILGMSRAEIDSKFDAIVDFAEIGDFINAPVATYSSGMTVRLGFAIAIHSDPDILLVDEVLAVGDISFVGKCYNKLNELKNKGVAIILVTHNMQNIFDFCKRGLLMNHGKQIIDCNVTEAVKEYEKVLVHNTINKEEKHQDESVLSSYIQSRVYLEDENGILIEEVDSNKKTYFCYEVISKVNMEDVFVTFHIQTLEGLTLIHIRNDVDNLGRLKIKEGLNVIKIGINNLNLQGGAYKSSFVLINNDIKMPVMSIDYFKPALIINGTKQNECVLNVSREWILN